MIKPTAAQKNGVGNLLGTSAHHVNGGYPLQPLAPCVAIGSVAPAVSQCQKSACPSSGWEYVDPRGKTQGPFTLDQMATWQKHGFFFPTLAMRCDPADKFVPFTALWPPGVQPFTHLVLRYRL